MDKQDVEVALHKALVHYLDGKFKDWDYEDSESMFTDLALILRLYKPSSNPSPHAVTRFYHNFYQRHSLPGVLPEGFETQVIADSMDTQQLAYILSELTAEWHAGLIDSRQFRTFADLAPDPHLKEMLL